MDFVQVWHASIDVGMDNVDLERIVDGDVWRKSVRLFQGSHVLFRTYRREVLPAGRFSLFAVAFEPRMGKLRSLSSDYCYRY
jgi:hypothetical protein